MVQIDTTTAYRALILVNALTLLASAAVLVKLPALKPLTSPRDEGRWVALKDAPYMMLVVLDGVMWIQSEVTDLRPAPVGGPAHGCATVVRRSGDRRQHSAGGVPADADQSWSHGRSACWPAIRRACFAFLIGTAVITTASGAPGWAAVAIMMVGVGVHTAGELRHAAGSLELRFRMVLAHAQGQYSGVFGMGMGLC
ncbi:hypothetical protein ABZ891_18185 [Streptomyces sp. NPDC047023]|uniref:hypothetical protein n=1 Tax=Streptomyces sp. NPDC047023 TaxID=3155139 RepID=UPI0034101904